MAWATMQEFLRGKRGRQLETLLEDDIIINQYMGGNTVYDIEYI